MAKKHLREPHIAENIQRMYQSGDSVEAIAAHYEVSFGTIRNILIEIGVYTSPFKTTTAEQEIIKQLREKNISDMQSLLPYMLTLDNIKRVLSDMPAQERQSLFYDVAMRQEQGAMNAPIAANQCNTLPYSQ